jgi:osmotically-inducible protein OsmY
MKSDLTRAAKKARGVRDVKDNMQVDQSMKGGGAGNGKSDTSGARTGAGAESVRATLLRERPTQSDVIKSLTITEEGDVILIRGTVPDEKTKKQIMDSAKKAAGNKTVRDDLEVKKK